MSWKENAQPNNTHTLRRTATGLFQRCATRWPQVGVGLLLSYSTQAAAQDASGEKAPLARVLDAGAGILGDRVREEAFAGFTWGLLLLSGVVLLLVVAAAEVLRWLLRRVARQQEAKKPADARQAKPAGSWLRLTLEALLPPLRVFVWIWGSYAAFALLFVETSAGSAAAFVAGLLVWLKNTGEIVALFWFLFRMIRVVEARLREWTTQTQSKWDDVLVALVGRALRLLVPLVGVILVVPTLDLPESSHQLFKQAASLGLIGAVGFVFFQLANAVEEAVLNQFRIDVKDNLEARKVYTQVKVLKKIAVVVIVLFTSASMLMVFDSVRQLGTSILASAGVLGIIVGFAAQRSIATVLAGFQIAITQPIRLDDVMIVENEWGRIEEITLTYVVVLIWDQRRLIVPINQFIEKPFQNWTRVSADILGSVFFYTDYTVPVEALRPEIERMVKANKDWDGRFWNLQVTDTTERTLQLRVLATAADASKAWDLRCALREQVVAFLQEKYPQSLPRLRAELRQTSTIPQPA